MDPWTRGEEGGVNWEMGTNVRALPVVKQIAKGTSRIV